MNNLEWLNKAKVKIESLTSGTVFEVKDLFDSLEWNKLSAKERQDFGRYFSTAFDDNQLNNIRRVHLSKKGPNKYEKE